MALAVAAGTSEAAVVTHAAVHAFARLGEPVVVMPLAALLADEVSSAAAVPDHLQAVVVPDHRRVECVAGADDLADLASCVPALAAADWHVVALVPAGAAGAAHRELRGTSAQLQLWWLDDDGRACFGGPEIP